MAWTTEIIAKNGVSQFYVDPVYYFKYPGSVNWTEQGHNFSWHMMLRGKRCGVRLYATDPRTGRTGTIDLRRYLSDHQTARFGRDLAMIHQLCQFIAKDLGNQGYPDVEIRAFALVSLNGRKPQLLIDPEVNLAAATRHGTCRSRSGSATFQFRTRSQNGSRRTRTRHQNASDSCARHASSP